MLLGVLVLLAAFWRCLRTARVALAQAEHPSGPFPDPPLGLRPAQLRYAMELSVDGKLILATLLDLAARGMVVIRLLPTREGAPGDFELRSTADARFPGLLPFEATLMEDLFGGGRTSLAREAVENELLANDLEAALREDAIRRGWLPAGHMTQQNVWRAVGAVLILAGFPSLFLFLIGFSLGPCLLPHPLLGFLALVLGWRLPDITPAGEEVAEVA